MAATPQKNTAARRTRYIEVCVESARKLLSYDTFSGTSDPFVVLSLKKHEEEKDDGPATAVKSYQSTTQMGTLEPTWNETFLFKDEGEKELVLKMYDYNKIGDDELMTTLTIPLSEVSDEPQQEGTWFPIIKEGTEDKSGGEILLKIEAFTDLRQLKGKLKSLKQQNKQLQETVDNLQKEKELEIAENAEKKSDIHHEETASAAGKVKDEETENEQQRLMDEMKKKIEELQSENQELKNDSKEGAVESQKVLEDLKVKHSSLQEQNKELQRKFDESKIEQIEAQKQNGLKDSETQNQVKEVEAKNVELQKQNEQLQKQCNELNDESAQQSLATEMQLKELRAQSEMLEKKCNELEHEKVAIQHKLDTVEQEPEPQQEPQQEPELQESAAVSSTQQLQMEKVQAENDDLRSELKNLRDEYEESLRSQEEKESQKTTKADDNDGGDRSELLHKITDLSTTKDDLEKQLSVLRGRCENLKVQLSQERPRWALGSAVVVTSIFLGLYYLKRSIG